MKHLFRSLEVTRIKPDGSPEIMNLSVAEEKPFTIYLNDKEIVTLLCTPQHLDELAVGFLSSEGFLRMDDLEDLQIDMKQGIGWVRSSKTRMIAERTFMKRYLTTGCGRGSSFYSLADTHCKPVHSRLRVPVQDVRQAIRYVQKSSQLYRMTHGVHSAALCSGSTIEVFREDVGRHNAIDKIVGRCVLEGIHMEDKFLVTTGRISSEILTKACKMGVAILVSRSAPTALAIEMAQQMNITLVGFARGGGITIFTGSERIN